MFPVLLGVVISNTALVGLLAAAAGLGGYLLVKGDGRVEARRREAVKLAQIASENGFPSVSEALSAYAIGDYSGIVSAGRGLYATLTDDTQRKAVFDSMLRVQLDKKLNDPVAKAEFLKLLEAKGLKFAEG